MATVKLGALIVGIAGSIGGWTFRRSGGSTIVYNKPSGASKNKLLLNSALSSLRSIIQGWSLLAQSVRDDWNSAAPLFLFPDKFGDLRALSGRLLYIKLGGSCDTVNLPAPDPNTLDSTILLNDIDTAFIEVGGEKSVTMQVGLSPDYYLIQVERLKNVAVSPTFSRRKIITFAQVALILKITFTTQFDEVYPNITAGEYFNIYVTPQNADGFRAVTQVIKVQCVSP